VSRSGRDMQGAPAGSSWRWRGRRVHGEGFTLAEVLIASVVLAVSVAAVAQAISAGQQQVYAALHELRAGFVGEAMIEEILAKPYEDPGGGDGESVRADFDDMQDYDGFTQAVGEVTDHAGQSLPPPYQRFGRSVSVTPATVSLDDLSASATGVTITVTVTDEGGRSWSYSRFVSEPGGG